MELCTLAQTLIVLVVCNPAGELGWVREEAPAQITSHFVWDLLQLDVPPQSAEQVSGPARFLQRLHYQAQRVQEFFGSLTYEGAMKAFTSTTAKVYSREEFNTRKLLLVSTKSGKVCVCGCLTPLYHTDTQTHMHTHTYKV